MMYYSLRFSVFGLRWLARESETVNRKLKTDYGTDTPSWLSSGGVSVGGN
jgi:hypothetical protein